MNKPWRTWGKKVAAHPEQYELHFEDETHLETNPRLCRTWPKRGQQPTLPAAGTNRRVTVFGSVEALGRGRVEVVTARQTSAEFGVYLGALDQRHSMTGKQVYLVLDNGPCHTSKVSRTALAERADWLQPVWLARYCPKLNPKEREWRYLKRDTRSQLARDLRPFVDEIVVGVDRWGGDHRLVVDQVPQWFIDGHRRPPTGRKPGRPVGATDRQPRAKRSKNLPAPT